MKKRILSAFLSLCMVLAVVPSVFAAEPPSDPDGNPAVVTGDPEKEPSSEEEEPNPGENEKPDAEKDISEEPGPGEGEESNPGKEPGEETNGEEGGETLTPTPPANGGLTQEEDVALFAEPVEDGIFQVGENSYATLKDAIESLEGGETLITLTGDFTGSSTNVAAIPLGVTLFVTNDSTLELPASALASMVTSEGSLEVSEGSNLILNYASYIGSTDDYYFKIVSGSMALRDFEGDVSAFKMDIVVTEDSIAEIPQNKNATLQPTRNKGADLTVEEGATLIVHGGLRGVTGTSDGQQYPSQFTIDGTLEFSETGFLSISAKVDVAVGEKGTLQIGEKGIITNSITSGYPSNPTPYNTKDKIVVADGGIISVASENTLNTNFINLVKAESGSLGTATDGNGNTLIGVVSGEPSTAEAQIGLHYYDSLDGADGALAAAQEGDTIVLLKNAAVAELTGNTIASGATLLVPDGKKLTVEMSGAGILASEGILMVEKGGTLMLPNSSGVSEEFIGGAAARLNLTQGSITYDFAANTLTLEEGAEAEVPADQKAYLMLDGEAIDGYIAEGASLTVKGTLKAVSGSGDGSTLTVDGELKVEKDGALAIAEKAEVQVNNGSLTLPLLSTKDIEGTGDGTGMRGDIVVSDKATVKYAGKYDVLGGNSPMLKLDSDSSATLNLANATLSLDKGAATVNGETKALLVTSDGTNTFVPLHISIAQGTQVTVAGKASLYIPKNGSLQLDGILNVEGQLKTSLNADVAISSSGTFELPLMSKSQMEELKSDITIEGGATVSYAGERITGDSSSFLTFNSGEAVLKLEKETDGSVSASLSLNSGSAVVNQDLKALLLSADSGDNIIPLQVEIAQEAAVKIPTGITLSIPNGGSLKADGSLSVNGTLEIHSKAELTGKLDLSGKLYIYGENPNLSASVALNGNDAALYAMVDLNIPNEEPTKGEYFYTSISGSTETFLYKWGTATEEPEPEKFTITATAGEGGSINPNGAVTVESGESITFTITPNEGYEIKDVTVNGKSQGAVASYIFENVTKDGIISASFQKVEEPENPDPDPDRPSGGNSGSGGGSGRPLPSDGSSTGPTFESDTTYDLTLNGVYQFRITSLNGAAPVMTLSNGNFRVELASQSGNDYFFKVYVVNPGQSCDVIVNGQKVVTVTAAAGVISDTTAPFTVAQGGTYQFKLTAAQQPAFVAGSPCFTVEYAGNIGNDWFYKVHAVGKVGEASGFYINGAPAPVAVATIG